MENTNPEMEEAPENLKGPGLFCKDLVKTYGPIRAVDGIDLEVGRGECFGLLGPNGAGKTTAVEIFEGLTEPDSGEVEVLGCAWSGLNDCDVKQKLGVQLQETQLPEKLTVEEVVRLFRSFYQRGHQVEDVIDMVELADKRKARVGKLSGGQKQRLALACSLVGDPELLFLDEPTTGLDPQARIKLWELIEGFHEKGGTVILTTHYMEEASRLCDRVAIMDHGKVIAKGTPLELVNSLGAEQIIEMTINKDLSPETFEKLPGVENVSLKNGDYRLGVADMGSALPALLHEVEKAGAKIDTLMTHQADLEDVFVELTGRGLRE